MTFWKVQLTRTRLETVTVLVEADSHQAVQDAVEDIKEEMSDKPDAVWKVDQDTDRDEHSILEDNDKCLVPHFLFCETLGINRLIKV